MQDGVELSVDTDGRRQELVCQQSVSASSRCAGVRWCGIQKIPRTALVASSTTRI